MHLNVVASQIRVPDELHNNSKFDKILDRTVGHLHSLQHKQRLAAVLASWLADRAYSGQPVVSCIALY